MKKLLSLLVSGFMIFTLMSPVLAANEPVASDGEQEFDTLQSAIDSNATKIKLLKDVNESIRISNKDVTIDLNGNAITANDADAIYVAKGASLTINGDGEVIAGKAGCASVFNNGNTVLNGGKYTRDGATNWYTIVNHGTMTLYDGVAVENLNTADVSSLVENGYSSYSGNNERNNYVEGTNEAEPLLTVNGGTFNTAGYNSVKNDEGGSLIINGGSFTSQRASGAVIQNWNKVEITGGTFTATKENTAVISNGTWGNYAKGNAVITGGNFIVDENAAKAVILGFGEGSSTGGSLTVEGGSFDGSFGNPTVYSVAIKNCTSTVAVPADMLASDVSQIMLSGDTTAYYVGNQDALAETVAKTNDMKEIQVLNGSIALSNIPNGVVVTNNSDGEVIINNETVGKDDTLTVHVCVYGEPTFNWNTDNYSKATASFDCVDGDSTVRMDAVITSTRVEPTVEKEGSITYVAKVVFEGKEYTDTKTVILDKLAPEEKAPIIISGNNAVWNQGSTNGLSFTSNAEFKDFKNVLVDGKVVDAQNYSVKEGSTIVTLKIEYLNTLSAGTHTLSIVSTNGSADTKFTISTKTNNETQSSTETTKPNTENPETAAAMFGGMFATMAVLSAGIAVVLWKKRELSK